METRENILKEIRDYLNEIGGGEWKCITTSMTYNDDEDDIIITSILKPKKIIHGLDDVWK